MVAIFVALMFISFVLVDLFVQKLETRARAVHALGTHASSHPTAPARAARIPAWMQVPEGVYLSQGHSWARPARGGIVRAGADTLVGQAIGAVSRVVLPRVGDEVKAGEPLFGVESNGRALTIASPVSGKVSKVNHLLQDQPGLLAEEAFDRGWVCAISPEAAVQENGFLHYGAGAIAWFEQEMDRFREFISARVAPEAALGLTAQDGGVPVKGVLASFDAETWEAFARSFLSREVHS